MLIKIEINMTIFVSVLWTEDPDPGFLPDPDSLKKIDTDLDPQQQKVLITTKKNHG